MQSEQNKIIITIDGYSSCGKSTLARSLARRLQYLHIDSGAMYRAVTLFFLRHHVDPTNESEVAAALKNIFILLEFEKTTQITWLNGEKVDTLIREAAVNELVSHVSTVSAVRKEMVAQQRRLGSEKGIVMDGRDIGTVVFPNAELKIFLTADIDVRVERRWLELKECGMEISYELVKANLLHRDHIDSTRHDSPLMQAPDAMVIDTSYLSEKEQLQIAYDLAQSVIIK